MPDTAELVLGIDLGTLSAKVGLFGSGGELLAFARHGYALQRPAPGRVEQDPSSWWAALCTGVRQVLGDRDAGAVRAMCVGGQGPTLVLADESGAPVRPAISWMDDRATEHAARLAHHVDGGRVAYSLVPRLLWLAEHEPETLSRARWALQAWDWLAYRLAGAGTSAVASTFPGDLVWWPAAVEAADLPPAARRLIPPHVDAGRAYATTTGAWAVEAGLPEGVPVVGGLNDGVGSFYGAAATRAGRAIDPGGAAGGLALCWDRPLAVQGGHTWPGIAPGTSIVGGAFAAGGRAVDWWAAASGTDVPGVLARAAEAPAGAGGVLFLPFLEGERAPIWDADLRGSFLGLSLEHGAHHLARAVVEATGFSPRLLGEAIEAAGGRIQELRLCGRQAESRFWNQVKADVTGYVVAVPRTTETALMCAAICAAVGAGWHPDLVAAAEAMVEVDYRLEPDPAGHAMYTARFQLFRAAYPALKALSPRAPDCPE